MKGRQTLVGACGGARGFTILLLHLYVLKFGRRMPSEAHLDTVWDTAGVRSDPCLMRVKGDLDLAGSAAGIGRPSAEAGKVFRRAGADVLPPFVGGEVVSG